MSGEKKNESTANDSEVPSGGIDKRQLARTQGRFSNDDERKFSSERTGSFSRRPNQEDRNFYQRRRKIDSIPPRRRNANYFQEKDQNQSEQRPRRQRMPMNENRVRYVADESYKFQNLEPKHEPIEIKKSGLHVLSETENGESRVYYYPSFLDAGKGYRLFAALHDETDWFEKEVFIDGERFPQPRLVAWYGPLEYSYSGVFLAPREFSDTVLKIKYEMEQQLKKEGINDEFNSVLLNLYRDNKDSVAWHSDDELSMGICPTIASVSLGEVRRFQMRRKASKTLPHNYVEYFANLKHGSLIVMDGVMQIDWEHRVPKEYHDKHPRINLTFRTVYAVERVQRPIGRVNLEKCIEDKAKSKAATSQEPFRYEDDSFPCLGSHKNEDETNPKTSQKINPEATTSKEMDMQFRQNRESMKKGRMDKRGKQFKNQNTRDYTNSPFQYRSGNRNRNKNRDVHPPHQSDNVDRSDKDPSSSPSHAPEDIPENSESVRENGTEHSCEARAGMSKSEDEPSNNSAVHRLQELKEYLSGALNEIQFSDRDKGEINVLLEFAGAWKRLPTKLIDTLVNRLEFLLNDVKISAEN